jgi:hypothetical protein
MEFQWYVEFTGANPSRERFQPDIAEVQGRIVDIIKQMKGKVAWRDSGSRTDSNITRKCDITLVAVDTTTDIFKDEPRSGHKIKTRFQIPFSVVQEAASSLNLRANWTEDRLRQLTWVVKDDITGTYTYKRFGMRAQ